MSKKRNHTLWTKLCSSCGKFVPSDYVSCDSCILSDVKLNGRGVYDALDYLCMKRLYTEEDVLKVIRQLKKELKTIEGG